MFGVFLKFYLYSKFQCAIFYYYVKYLRYVIEYYLILSISKFITWNYILLFLTTSVLICCSCYQANVTEEKGNVHLYSGWDSKDFQKLIRTPCRATNDYYTIDDIFASGQELDKQFVNILAAVNKVCIKNSFII